MARKVMNGPMVPGPWAYAFALGTVIDTQGGTKAESERLRAQGLEHDVAQGDNLVIDGNEYIAVAASGGGNYGLALVRMVPVTTSTNVVAYRYDEETQVLVTRFKGGALYAYLRRQPNSVPRLPHGSQQAKLCQG